MKLGVLAAALTLLALTLPAVAASACVPTCEVLATLAGFTPPALLATSGSTVTWTSLDVPHTINPADGFCFSLTHVRGQTVSATFTLAGGVLSATVGSTTKSCTGATILPDGSARLPYYCPQHPNTMKAELLVK